MKKKLITGLGLLFLMFTLTLVGCGGGSSDEAGLSEISTAQSESLSESGTIILRINPEVAIEYDENGKVTSVSGRNDDGREIINSYADYIGKDSGLVLEELVAMIGEAGYFIEEVEGEPRRIVLELESGSILPDEEFLEKMTVNVQTAVSKLNVESKVVSSEDMISLDEAKRIALADADVKEADVKFDDKELDKDDGNLSYELEFYANGIEYEYDVHAVTGDIIKVERDRTDDKKVSKPVPKKDKAQATEQSTKEKPKAPKQATKKSDYIGMDKAKQIAFNHAGVNGANARFDDQEFDIDDGVPSYELEFDVNGNEYEYDIHAVSGAILDYEHDIKQAAKPASKPAPAPKPAPVPKPAPAKPKQLSKDEAINIALGHAGLSRSQVVFDDVESDWDDGRLEWEIEFHSGNWEYEYEIDGHTGSILDFDKEHDD